MLASMAHLAFLQEIFPLDLEVFLLQLVVQLAQLAELKESSLLHKQTYWDRLDFVQRNSSVVSHQFLEMP